MWIRLCSKFIVWTNTRHNCKGMGRGRTMFIYCYLGSEFKDIYLRLIVQWALWLFFKIFIMDANRQWHNDGRIKKYWFKMIFMDEFHQIWFKNGCSCIFYSWMTNCKVWQILNKHLSFLWNPKIEKHALLWKHGHLSYAHLLYLAFVKQLGPT